MATPFFFICGLSITGQSASNSVLLSPEGEDKNECSKSP